jgi:Fe-S cluster assembly protein SufD
MDAFAIATDAVLAERRGDPGWLARLRRDAARRYTTLGLPTVRDEQWKYTDVTPLAAAPLRPATAADAAALAGPAFDALPLATASPWRAVLVNGGFRADLSRLADLPPGTTVTSLGAVLDTRTDRLATTLEAALATGDAFTALNTALLGDGCLIEIADDVVAEEPLHLVFVGHGPATGILRGPRVIVHAGRHSRVRLIEEYVSVSADEDAGLTNALSEVVLAAGARVDHHRLQTEGARAAHIGRLAVTAAADSRFESDSVVFGGSLTRIDITVALAGRGASCRLNGLFVGGDHQHVDHHTRIDHQVGDTHSTELYRGILDGRSRGVFNGKVVVHPDAQQITALQTSNNLLLSRHAEIDTKPELEIYADDVRCTHGATVGELDAAALFYLRSGVLPEDDARALLTYAFAQEVAAGIPLGGVRRWIEERFLGHGRHGELIAALGQP